MSTRSLQVRAPGPLATVQDLGRAGCSDLGVGVSGAADRGAVRLANRLLGNPEHAAVLEVTFGGLQVQAQGPLVVALTGAPASATVDGSPVGHAAPVHLPAGSELHLGVPAAGCRTYLGVRGGVDVPPVLGSRARDVLAGLGPEPLAEGDVLPVGLPPTDPPPLDQAPVPPVPAADADVTVRAVLGPRDDWLTADAVDALLHQRWEVTSESDRVGMRLDGPALERARDDELPSEGLVRGAVQVPPSGRPVVFLADHPVTGGYPVAAVVLDDDVDLLAQVRPGQHVRLRAVAPSWRATGRRP